MWVEWHDFWLKKVKQNKTPIFFFRFEDLLLQPEPVLKDMFRFILGAEKGIDNTIIEKRIQDVIHTGKNFLYKPRQAGGGFHKHEKLLTKKQMDDLMSKLEYYIHFFGYAKDERSGDISNAPAPASSFNSYTPQIFDFYDYKGQASQGSKDAYMDYLKVNEAMFQLRLKNKNSPAEKVKESLIKINGNGNGEDDGFSMLLKKEILNYVELIEYSHIADPTKAVKSEKEKAA